MRKPTIEEATFIEGAITQPKRKKSGITVPMNVRIPIELDRRLTVFMCDLRIEGDDDITKRQIVEEALSQYLTGKEKGVDRKGR